MWPRLLLLSFFLCLQVVTSFHNHVHRGTHLPLHTKFLRRDDYACDANNPCRNGACCGAGGYCGYGSTYCGDGCLSNCEATAECGQFADPANTTCPLNTCCSQYGFCGTTEEFCTDNCQSNCVLHPNPPSGSTQNKTLSKVIGYYEAWSDRSKCHQTSPSDLPLDALTHLNYAFAYLNPETYQVMTMDVATPVDLFDRVAALKTDKPELKIFISIGGWTFSDNNTVTQPVFGEIARSASARQAFASNVLTFLDEYGFDGVDIDWEYPAAGDRGGKPDDTKNYVKLLQSLREKFDGSGRDLGITFTAPSSYWYMRWFDLPSMLKYADWMNLMTYDLHGVWDANNAIGSIVKAHTNLTEIKLAAELLWRVDVKPHQVALGFGFYGRSFTLQDPSCTTVGCPFSGGADPGICTDTSGYLAYYEIDQILSKNSDINVVHDKEAAVKYFTWNTNQWISYDDKETFQQKLEWADGIGFSGSLIWASDQDTYNLDAHKAFTGNDNLGKLSVQAKAATSPTDVALELNGDLGTTCYVRKDKVDLNNPQASSCSPDIRVGYDNAGCNEKNGKCGKPVCCPASTGLTQCQWRGGTHGAKDCNGECHAGEVKIATSSYGGTPGESGTSHCNRGTKALCCQMAGLGTLTDQCYWTSGNGKSCDIAYYEAAHKWEGDGWSTVFSHGSSYCCPATSQRPLSNCHWVGKGDCADNTCSASEVTLLVDNRGDSYSGCNWGRKKSLCCTPNTDALAILTCDQDICDAIGGCDDEDNTSVPTDGYYSFSKRSSIIERTHQSPYVVERAKPIVRPGDPRQMLVFINSILKTSIFKHLTLTSRPYPPGLAVLKGDGASTLSLQGGFSMLSNVCSNTVVKYQAAKDLATKGFHAEHLQEIQLPSILMITALGGYLPTGRKMKANRIDPYKLLATWNNPYAVSLARIGVRVTDVAGWVAPLTPNDRIFEVIGSYAYRGSMSVLWGSTNVIKGKIMSFQNPMALGVFNTNMRNIANKGSMEAAEKIAGVLQQTIGTFSYLNDAVLGDAFNDARQVLKDEWANYDKYQLPGMLDIWEEFEPDYYQHVAAEALAFMNSRIQLIENKFALASTVTNPAATKLLYDARQLKGKLDQIKFTFD